ncbi:galactokinase [Pontibacter ramchanderi]|uniref:Galactokinase n=1 Tax=Pontibacter ramchanderi TaxID=1179743 RepID=A0A2N3U9T6_9BACT|nr:galactokinase [Pontibacter ramchanderi]PKV63507.1 galactokinase [Pontibacter ramchanderi]
MLNKIKQAFQARYNGEPIIVRSPGRVNLIGEHTDYNEGFVLPAAIDKEIYFAVAPNQGHFFRVYAFDLQQEAEFDLRQVQRTELSWANYLLGVIAQFQQAGYDVRGFDLVYGGNIPIGAGISSSAAVECGLAFALNHLFELGIPKFDMVKMAQMAEHSYAGVRCGIMDQFASMYGRQGHAVRLDCRSLEFDYYPLDMADYRIVLCDTQVKHSLASSEYNTRRQECEAGVALLQRHYPQVRSLRDVTMGMLEQHQEEFNPTVYRRCTFVVHENNRVEEACLALEQGDMHTFGEKMYASHRGLQHDYEVSCPELDFLVEQTHDLEEVLGARMMGGGFGGCTINLVKLEALGGFTEKMEEAYRLQFGIQLKTYVAEIADGSSLEESHNL